MSSPTVRDVKYKYYWVVMRNFVPEPKKINRQTREWIGFRTMLHDVHYLVKAASAELEDGQVVGRQDKRLTLTTELPSNIKEGDEPPVDFLEQADGFFEPLKNPFPWEDIEDQREETFNHIGGLTDRIAKTQEGFGDPKWSPKIDIHFFELGHKKPMRIEL